MSGAPRGAGPSGEPVSRSPAAGRSPWGGRPAIGEPAGGYGAQGAVTAQLTSSVHEVALSKEFEPPSLAM